MLYTCLGPPLFGDVGEVGEPGEPGECGELGSSSFIRVNLAAFFHSDLPENLLAKLIFCGAV